MEVNQYTIDKQNYSFKEAKKIITSQELLEKFLKGETFKKILDFICFLQKSVEGININDTPFPDNVNIF